MLIEGALAIHAHFPWAWPLLGGVLGGVLGSFAGCMAERSAQGVGLRYPPSHCPTCKRMLGVIDLIPIVSWFALAGRCRTCKAAIPVKLLLAEVCGALTMAGLVWVLLP